MSWSDYMREHGREEYDAWDAVAQPIYDRGWREGAEAMRDAVYQHALKICTTYQVKSLKAVPIPEPPR